MKKNIKPFTYVYVDNIKLNSNSGMKRNQKFLVCDWGDKPENPVERLGAIKKQFDDAGMTSRYTEFRIGKE
jgi:hypothetical protein